jgi:hypothetical protein
MMPFVAHRRKGGIAKFFSALLVKVRMDIVHVMLNQGRTSSGPTKLRHLSEHTYEGLLHIEPITQGRYIPISVQTREAILPLVGKLKSDRRLLNLRWHHSVFNYGKPR